jgi:hypothetical protein
LGDDWREDAFLNRSLAVQGHFLLKNLGWARLQQERYDDAESRLLDAIDITERWLYDPMNPVHKPPAAYCLMAQVINKQFTQSRNRQHSNENISLQAREQYLKDLEQYIEHLESCSRSFYYAPSYEENQWKYEANEKLEELQSCPESQILEDSLANGFFLCKRKDTD